MLEAVRQLNNRDAHSDTSNNLPSCKSCLSLLVQVFRVFPSFNRDCALMLGETNQSSRYSLAYVRVKEQTETDRAIVMVCFSSSGEMALSAFLCRTKSSWMCCVAIKVRNLDVTTSSQLAPQKLYLSLQCFPSLHPVSGAGRPPSCLSTAA